MSQSTTVTWFVVLSAMLLCPQHFVAAQIRWAGEGSGVAEAIVIGELRSLRETTPRLLDLELTVTRVIKGTLTSGTIIPITVATRAAANRVPQGAGLWFLKKVEGQWKVMPVLGNPAFLETGYFVPLSDASRQPGRISEKSSTTVNYSVNDQIAVEVFAAVRNHSSRMQMFLLGQVLDSLEQTPFVVGAFRELSASADPEVRVAGLAGMLGCDDEDVTWALSQIANDMERILKTDARSLLIPSICSIRNRDPRAVASLGKLTSSGEVTLKRCAASALDIIHTPDTLPWLAGLLDDGDARTREYAIQGLSRFVDNLPIQNSSNIMTGLAYLPQGPTPFRTVETDRYSLSKGWLDGADEKPYLSFWRAWWASMKDELQPASTPEPASTAP